MSEELQIQTVSEAEAGMRLDQAAAALFPAFSRARLQAWIRDGRLTCNNGTQPVRHRVQAGDCLALRVIEEDRTEDQPEAIPLDILYEDDALLVVNKPAGLVVHPGSGVAAGTLLNGLLHHCQQASLLPRAGIVHRLDRDTSGLMVVSKTEVARQNLVGQLQARTVSREYDALVTGQVLVGGTVDAPIGRHPSQRTKMAVVRGHAGKQAISHYRVMERYVKHSWLRVRLETGRTHQIRVHMAFRGFPLVGDKTYGARPVIPAGATDDLRLALQQFPRQALHARKLSFMHPLSGKCLSFRAPVPGDMMDLIELLRAHQG
jgi:23S rRNA pseudouridine1911/1915/1917 synthase